MAQATGLFGTGVGSKVSQKAKAPRTQPAGILKLVAPHASAPPSFHTPASKMLSQTAMYGGSQSTHATDWPSSLGSGYVNQSGGSSNPLGEVLHGVEGFIGHLGSDVIHTALGMPAGIAYMFEHPIAGAEMTVKATWNDWSPLFHGDVRLWLHNTWEHPLAPILDVASVMTLGAAGAARGAAIAGRLGEAADAASAATAASTGATGTAVTVRASTGLARTATNVARLRHLGNPAVFQKVIDEAGVAGRAAGAANEGIAASEWWQKLQRFAHPADYAAKQYEQIGERLGYSHEANTEFVNQAMSQDNIARRIYDGPAGTNIKVHKDVSNNPWTRTRQASLRKLNNKVGQQSPMLGKLLGDDATFNRVLSADKGTRRAAMGNVIHRQLHAISDAGKVIANLLPHEWLARIEPTMFKGLIAQAHEVAPLGALGSKELQAQLDALGDSGLQAVKSHASRQAGLNKAYQHVMDAHAAGKSDAGVDTFLKTEWSTASVTNKADEVLLDGNGNLRVVSRPDRIGREVQGSSRVAQLLYTNPTALWKYLILGASPRYFVNNFVGNSLMLLAATDPVSVTRAFHAYLTTGRKMDAAFKEMYDKMAAGGASAAELQGFLLDRKIQGRHWMDKWFAGEYGFGESNRIHPRGEEGQDLRGSGFIGKLNTKYSLHHVTNKLADMPQRYTALQYSMKRMPEFQRAYAQLRARGASHFFAEQRAADMAAASPAVRAIVRQQVHHMLGQYHTFNKVERGIRTVIPFYAWDRAIAVHMKELVVQAPYKVAMGAAIGSLGQVKLQEIMGQTPDFLQSAIPAKLLGGPLGIIDAITGHQTGRTNVLMAQGLNPYASVADLTKMAAVALPGGGGIKGLRAGESLGATLNPLIQSTAETLSGVSLMTGGPINSNPLNAGPIAGIYLNAFGHVPQFNMLQALLGMEGGSKTKTGKDTLYAHTLAQQVSSWLGVPLRQVSLPAAKTMYDKQMGVKKKHNNMATAPGL